jgi:hypothetical protein
MMERFNLGSAAGHPIFVHSLRTLDALQRAYMRALGYAEPTKDCRTVFDSIVRGNSRDCVQRRIRFFEIFDHNLAYDTMNRLREGDLYVDSGANIGPLACSSRVTSETV